MATLSGNKIKDTYQSLVKFSDNGNITVGAKQLTDGFGNNSPMFVSTTQVGIGVTPEAGLNLHVFGDAKIGSNLTVIGNLVVEGSTTTVGTDTLTVKDPLIVLANNNTSTDAVDIGFYGKYTPSGTTLYSGLFREALTGKYRLFKGLEDEPTTTVNTSGTGYAKADLVIGDLNAIDIEALGNISTPYGTISGDIVGGSISGSTGDFSGNVDIDGQLDVDDVINIQGSAFGRIEIGGNSGGYIDLKAPNSDDYDFRIITSSGGNEITTATGDLIFNTAETLALTIDTSQDATFVGGVTANSFSGNLTGNVTGNLTGNVTGDVTGNVTGDLTGDVTGDVTGNVTGDLTGNVTATSVLADGVTATTQSDGDNSTKVATTAYVDTAIEGHDTLAEVLAGGNTSGGTSMIISNGDDLTVNTSTLKVDSTNSQVGINNASPSGFTGQYSKDLIIGDGTGDRGITIYSSSSAYGSLFFKDAEGSSTGNGGFIAYNHFVDGMEFGIGNAGLGAGSLSIGSTSIFMKKKLIVDATYSTTNTLTVDPSNVRVGIFNDSPSYRLDVAGDARFTGQTIISSDLTVDTDTLFVDASEDSVGINTANPSAFGRNELVVTVPDNGGMTIASATDEYGMIEFSDGSDTGQQNFIGCDHDGDIMGFNAWGYHLFSLGEGVPKMTINTAGVTVEDDFKAGDLGDPYLLFADVSASTVYVEGELDVTGNATFAGNVELKSNAGGATKFLRIWNEGTVDATDDALITWQTQASRTYSMGIHRDSGSLTISNQDASVASGELITIDSSGNSTFSGDVTVNNSSGDFGAEAILKGTTSTGTPKGEIAFKRGTSGDGANMVLRTSNSSGTIQNVLTLDTDRNATFAGNVILNQATSRIYGGGTATGRFFLGNSDSKSYMMINGSAHTNPNLIYFVNDAAVTLTLNADNSATFAGNVKIADEKILGLRTSSNDYAIQYRDLDFRFIGSADSSTQRKFSFGYYTSDNPAGTWNGKVYINSYTGSVGIGTDSPDTPLDVQGAIQASESGGDFIRMQTDGTNNIFDVNSGAYVFRTSGFSERMRITSGGALIVNTDLPNGSTGVFYNNSSTTPYGVACSLPNGSVDNTRYLFFGDCAGASKFKVSTAGQIYAVATSIASISDIRFKENIRDIDTGLEEILKLKPRLFDWKENKGKNEKDSVGFIAQEVEEVLPKLVQKNWSDNGINEDGSAIEGEKYKTVSQADMIPTLVKAIQELKAEVDLLKQECKCKN